MLKQNIEREGKTNLIKFVGKGSWEKSVKELLGIQSNKNRKEPWNASGIFHSIDRSLIF